MKINEEEYIELGRCSKPHGIKGAFAFHLYNTEDSVLKKGSKVYLIPKDGSKLPVEGQEFQISQISFGNKVITFLKEVTDRNKVEEMLPFDIYFKRSDLPEVGEDEFYLDDLIGLSILDAKTGEKVGKISSFYDNSAQIILEIRGEQNIEIPMIDNFVVETNIEEGFMKINVPEYLGDDE
ncbi:MAG: 16S rRNA processing protein RimM [Bacteriovoracaceae bacterium]|jgi:16S rRNA processing protein RimM